MNIDELMEELEDKKVLVEILERGITGAGAKQIDGNKLSTLAVKFSQSLDKKANSNTKAIAALCLLSIASNLDAAPAQKLLTKAIGILG